MKPLLKKDLSTFLKRFNDFRDAELRSLEIISPTAVKITLEAQDSAREFDWITISLELSGISDANLPQNSKLPHIDMSDGITIIFTDTQIAFGIGNYDNFSNITNSICYIKATSIKYQESIY
jgi:hypothetical protein